MHGVGAKNTIERARPSGGAICIRDPKRRVGEEQLNGGKFVEFSSDHWDLIKPMLLENERLFGIPVDYLLPEGSEPEEFYRVIVPAEQSVLQPEQAWVSH